MDNIMNSPYDENGFLKGKPDGKGVAKTFRPGPKPKDPAALYERSKTEEATNEREGGRRMGL